MSDSSSVINIEDSYKSLVEQIAMFINKQEQFNKKQEQKIDKFIETQKAILPKLLESIVSQNELWTPSVMSTKRSKNFRKNLMKSLKCSMPAKCMATGLKGEREQHVIAAHIIPVKARTRHLKMLGMSHADVNSTRNGLFLCSNIEKMFDKQKLTFCKSPNIFEDKLVLRIFDDSIKDMSVYDGSKEKIGDYEGVELKLEGHNPFMRALSYHAYDTYLKYNLEPISRSMYSSPGNQIFYNMTIELKNNFLKIKSNELNDIEDNDDDSHVDDDDDEGSDDDKDNYDDDQGTKSSQNKKMKLT